MTEEWPATIAEIERRARNAAIDECAAIADAWYNADTSDELNKFALPSEAIRTTLKGNEVAERMK